ncbi:TPA: hypothetical protein NJ815_004515 [Vibrio parahaemolyticus]|nr:hypothetical protein [Vibrio parahaemolyticus]HCG8650280.1 hypothetical protein [Vibrio parahaemolyticus]
MPSYSQIEESFVPELVKVAIEEGGYYILAEKKNDNSWTVSWKTDEDS